MHKFKEWAENTIGLDTSSPIEAQREIAIDLVVENNAFIDELKGKVD